MTKSLIYHKDTEGHEGFNTLEAMIYQNFVLGPHSHTIHYANSVFEGIRAVWDENEEKLYLITLDQHINRFLRSINKKFHGNLNKNDLYESEAYNKKDDQADDKAFGVTAPKTTEMAFLDLTYDEIEKAIIETIQRNVKAGNIDPKKGCYVRPIVFRNGTFDENGDPQINLGVYSLKHSVVFQILAFTWGKYLKGNPKTIVGLEGIDTPLRHIKAGGNYAYGGMEKDWAMLRGYDEVIITDSSPDRNVLEGGGENIFVYIGDVIFTPDKSQSILPGTKRNLVIEISKNFGYNLVETKIPLDIFLQARSAAFSGTATGYVGIDRVKDAKTGRKKIFDLDYEPMVKTVDEFQKVLSGKSSNKKNRELQKKIRTEVPL